jgi:hypothetical protein
MPLQSLDPGVGAPPPPHEIRAELETILSTPAFRRSERQSRFLRFVCEATLQGESSKLNEILIAYEVFGRGTDYSPGEDAVVRRQAHSLRQKLQEYYAGDGAKDPIRIELPVGRYVPVFLRASNNDPIAASGSVAAALQGQAMPKPTHIRRLAGFVAVLILSAFGAGWWYGRSGQEHRSSRATTGALAELWGGWLSKPAGAVICFSNPVTTVVKQFQMQLPLDSLPRRISVTPEQETQLREALELPPGGFVYLSPAISQAKMGEAIGAVALANLFARSSVRVQATQTRFLNWKDFRSQNLILLGHDEANRWLDPLLKHLPFRLAATEGDRPRRIVDTAPRSGERREYQNQFSSRSKDQPSEDYALISMIQGIDHEHELLLLNGLNSEGTQSAIEYLTDPFTVQQLVSTLRKAAPSHRGRWRFQVVLHTEVRDKVPTRADLVALRVLQ